MNFAGYLLPLPHYVKYIRTEQSICFIDVNCAVFLSYIHKYNNKFINGHNRCIYDLTTKS